MNTDHYFEIGSSHAKCEDYATSGVLHNGGNHSLAYAIVSDGCSGSLSPYTDVGARLYCLVTQDVLRFLMSQWHFKDDPDGTFFQKLFPYTLRDLVLQRCMQLCGSLGMSYDMFDATLLCAIMLSDGRRAVVGWGDGTIIVKYKDGVTRLITITFDEQRPYYLSYEMSSKKKKAFIGSSDDSNVEEYTHILNLPEGDPRIKLCHPGWCSGENYDVATEYMFHSTFSDPPPIKFAEGPEKASQCQEITQLIVCSDGVSSFQKDPRIHGPSEPIPIEEIYKDVSDYKILNGPFVERRIRRLATQNRHREIIHTDDLAVAAISNVETNES